MEIKRFKNYITWKNKKGEFNARRKRASLENDIALTLQTAQVNMIAERESMKDNYVVGQIKKAIDKNNGEIPPTVDIYNAQPRKDDVSTTLTTTSGHLGGSGSLGIIERKNMRIRKITPKEAMRLMAFQDTDTNSMKISESGIYHCAGDSICVNVLISLFAQLLDIDNVEITKKYIEEIKNAN